MSCVEVTQQLLRHKASSAGCTQTLQNLPLVLIVCVSVCVQEMVDWFTAIRAARFHYQKVAFPGANDEDVCESNFFQKLTHKNEL